MMGVAQNESRQRKWSPVPLEIEPKIREALQTYLEEQGRPAIITVQTLMSEMRSRVATTRKWSDKQLKSALTWAIRPEGHSLRGATAYQRQDPAHPVRREEA